MISPEDKHNCSKESPEKKEGRHENFQPTRLVNSMKKSVKALPTFVISKVFESGAKVNHHHYWHNHCEG